jgi:hypothetical protein
VKSVVKLSFVLPSAYSATTNLEEIINESRTKRCSEREPAVSIRDKFTAIGGWLSSLTYPLVVIPVSQVKADCRRTTPKKLK